MAVAAAPPPGPPVAAGAVAAFAAGVRGEVVRPGDADYDARRRVWNALIDRRPALIVRCTGAADVLAGVRFAREHGLAVAVRGGGHNVAGSAVCDGGLMLDLSPMGGVRVDPDARAVRVHGGAVWGAVDRETQVFGLATPSGCVSTTGVAGFALGGGYGHLRRQYGLTCNSLLAADVVTADGRLVRAQPAAHDDLYWALRGGGGNFGVVTSFEFRCYPVGPEIFLGAVLYPFADAAPVLRRWREHMDAAPEELSSNVLIWTVPAGPAFPAALHGRPVVIVTALYPGGPEAGERLTGPLRRLGTPVADLSGAMPYVAAQAAFDPFFPAGVRRNYWKAIDLDRFDDAVAARVIEAGVTRPTPASIVGVWHFGGAMSRVAPDATAFWRRRVPFMANFDAAWTDPADDAPAIAWSRGACDAVRPYSDGGQYVNFPGLGEDGAAQARAAYGGNYDRLRAVKAAYDPTNLFRCNVNIPPAGAAATTV